MNCSDNYGEDWGDVTGEKQEAMEESIFVTGVGFTQPCEWTIVGSIADGDDAA